MRVHLPRPPSTLEELVKAQAAALKLTQAELARRVEVSVNVLSKSLRGQMRLTTPVALRLAGVLKLDARALLAAAPVFRRYGVSPR